MSFFCPWQDGTQEICHRTANTPCTPGKPGCVLYGKVVFASDEPEVQPKRRRRSAPVTRPEASGASDEADG